MIQRIQSVYLLLAAAALVAVLFFGSVWQPATASFGLFTFTFVAVSVAAGLVALVAVFLYQNRPRQRRVVFGVQVLALIQTALLYGGLYLVGALRYTSPATGQVDVGRVVVLLLPVLGYGLLYLARRAITSDIELVRSMDRLR
jgi:NADH:ubiquinone oxidoreductase subunit K